MKRAISYRSSVNNFFLFISTSICLLLLFHIFSTDTSATTVSKDANGSSSTAFTANAAGKPGRVNPICVDSHLNGLSTANVDRQLNLMQQAGIVWTRFDFYRSGVET